MSLFWLGAVCLAVIALLLVAFPWIRQGSRADVDHLTNTQIIKQRINELETEVSEGVLSESDKQQAIDELKLALLDESDNRGHSQKSTAPYAAWVMAAIALSIGAVIYLNSNEVSSIAHWQQVTQQTKELANRIVVEADPSVTGEDLEDFALAMRTRLIDKPDDAIGWLLLGRLHASTRRIDSALEAFERALVLDPNHPGVLSSYSQALLMTGQEEGLRKAQRLIRRSLALDPEDINSLGMLAVTTTQLGQNEEAIDIWQQLKEKLPQSDPMHAEIDKRIDTLKGGTASQTSVVITVTLEPSLLAKLPEGGFLFVFAQDPSGSVKMPASVVKLPVGEFPTQVTLSDANAMMPTYTLSQLSEARLVARISADENVAPAAGELQGEVVITLNNGTQQSQQIKIDKELM